MSRVVHQRVTVKIFGKQPFAKRNAVFLAHRVKSVRLPHCIRRFNNKCRGVGIKLVRMCGKPAVLGLLKGKSEGIKGFLCAQPHKAAVAHFYVGFVGVGITGTNATVQPVTSNHQVGVVLPRCGLVVLHIRFKYQFNTQRNAAFLQNVQHFFASNPAKAVATRAHAATFKKHFHIVPMVEGIANQLRTHWIGRPQVAQCLVRQHHAPAKGVKRPISFNYGNDMGGVLQLH